MTKTKILIATGGTGGHIFPAYSLANYLKRKDYSVDLTTDKRGLFFLKNEKKLNFIEIPASPLIKKNSIKFLASLIVIIYSIIKSFSYLVRNRPSIIFGMGGYSSFPVCIAASILRIKFVIYENNLIIGKANKYLLPFANKIFVSYKSLEGIPVKYNEKVIEIGNIIREEIIQSKSAVSEKGKFDKLNILVLGGSQAARVFADKLPSIFKKLKKNYIPIKIFQQCQKIQNNTLSEFYRNSVIDHELFNFSERILEYYLNVNLVITRSGASVLGELINVKTPFISIPLPTSADNHQFKNAKFYSKKGYGFLLEEKDIENKLFDLINSFYKDKSLIKKIISNQMQYSDKDIFEKLRHQMKKILNEKN